MESRNKWGVAEPLAFYCDEGLCIFTSGGKASCTVVMYQIEVVLVVTVANPHAFLLVVCEEVVIRNKLQIQMKRQEVDLFSFRMKSHK